MEQLQQFVSLAQTDRFTVTELCLQFGISRKTGYKHLERYALGGMKALAGQMPDANEVQMRTRSGQMRTRSGC